MGLASRMSEVRPSKSWRAGVCASCSWIEGLSEEDRGVISTWVNSGNSVAQLYDQCTSEGLTLHLSTFSRCLKRHRGLGL